MEISGSSSASFSFLCEIFESVFEFVTFIEGGCFVTKDDAAFKCHSLDLLFYDEGENAHINSPYCLALCALTRPHLRIIRFIVTYLMENSMKVKRSSARAKNSTQLFVLLRSDSKVIIDPSIGNVQKERERDKSVSSATLTKLRFFLSLKRASRLKIMRPEIEP